MKNWKTTLSGLVSAAAAFVALSPQLFIRWPWAVELAKFISVGGLASLGLAAKDKNVTGGTILNNPPAETATQLKSEK